MKISIVGAGVVGQATGIGLARRGNEVIFNDIDENKIANLKKNGYRVVEDIFEVVIDSEIVFVCLPTPNFNNNLDLRIIDSFIDDLAHALKKTKKHIVLVIRSTVLPQTTRTKIIPALEEGSGLVAGKDFGVCVNPEFLRETSSFSDFSNPCRVVIGDFDKKSGDVLESIYTPFNCPIVRTDLDSAEMIKYVSNLFLAAKISFFNEVFMICNKIGLDANLINEAVSKDSRIGKYGIYGGRAFGGHCFPKDLTAFLSFTKSLGLNCNLIEAVNTVNEEIKLLNLQNER